MFVFILSSISGGKFCCQLPSSVEGNRGAMQAKTRFAESYFQASKRA